MMYAELWVKRVSKCGWMARALTVPTRLWLGGVISPRRDRALITALVQKVWAGARSLAIRVCVDGLASYVTALLRGFRDPVRRGRRGRPRLVVESGLLIGQVIKRYARRRVATVVLPCGAGDHHGHCQRAQRHRRRHPDQHRLYRAAQCHLCERPGAPGAPRTRLAHTEAGLTAGM
jgi:hypothetical protein